MARMQAAKDAVPALPPVGFGPRDAEFAGRGKRVPQRVWRTDDEGRVRVGRADTAAVVAAHRDRWVAAEEAADRAGDAERVVGPIRAVSREWTGAAGS